MVSAEEISQLQLWREQEFAKYEAIEEKSQFALQLLMPVINTLVKQHMKLHVSDMHQKQALLEKLRGIISG